MRPKRSALVAALCAASLLLGAVAVPDVAMAKSESTSQHSKTGAKKKAQSKKAKGKVSKKSNDKKKRTISKKAFAEKSKKGRKLNKRQVKTASKRAAKLAAYVGSHGVAAAQADNAVVDMTDEPIDGLRFNSSVVLVEDAVTGVPVLSKNPEIRAPIASITKMMAALVVVESGVDLEETVTITHEEVQRTAGQRSSLGPGARFTKRELLHMALMSSENRAAAALARTHPGGFEHFVRLMNEKAKKLGMTNSHFTESTGLSSGNQSTARDLAKLVRAAVKHEIIREFSTDEVATIDVGRYDRNFRNTNSLIRRGDWSISLQKTGFTTPAGRCQILYAFVDDRPYVIVMLDANHGASREADALRIKSVLTASQAFAAHKMD